ncbi:hypothetical protein Rt10032_c07g3155 [Rhodotorula toruloides]|uniref:Uncharacterized protein n=1 Tax=Rhodotorula toruloides TaxID=5286 RepID=A0A511KFJ6_RHOTO|nr:hypothetical protein Rt10032_c07g3155 [Rhodotorula toruloides]
MLLASLATALLALSSFAIASNSSSATLSDLEPIDLPEPRTLIYKEVCFANVFEGAGASTFLFPKRESALTRLPSLVDDILDTPQTQHKDSNSHPIFYRTGTKRDFDPVVDPAATEGVEKEGHHEGGELFGFEEFCYRMRRAKKDAAKEKGAGAGTLPVKSR